MSKNTVEKPLIRHARDTLMTTVESLALCAPSIAATPAAAAPFSGDSQVYRSDQLIGASIVNVADENLGNVEAIVMSPQTGKIAYLVIGHGGFWGSCHEQRTRTARGPIDQGDQANGSNLRRIPIV